MSNMNKFLINDFLLFVSCLSNQHRLCLKTWYLCLSSSKTSTRGHFSIILPERVDSKKKSMLQINAKLI